MNRPVFIAIAALVAAFVVGSSTAATSQTAQTIIACYNRAQSTFPGGLYLKSFSSTGRCADDLEITWNAQGPPGPSGPQGAAGPPGVTGATGERGPAGSLSQATAARIAAKLRQVEAAERRLAKAKPGSAAERKSLLALSRAQRQATAALVAALSG